MFTISHAYAQTAINFLTTLQDSTFLTTFQDLVLPGNMSTTTTSTAAVQANTVANTKPSQVQQKRARN